MALMEPNRLAKYQLHMLYTEAAKNGDLNVLQPLLNEDREDLASFRIDCAISAISGGRLEVLQWLLAEGVLEMGPWACEVAACDGHHNILQWLHENGCPWDVDTCSAAASVGRTNTLKWLRDNGCPWNAETCVLASFHGHLETLRWARANGCPWDKDACALGARASGYPHVAEWIEAQN
jgi:hypothetical protein